MAAKGFASSANLRELGRRVWNEISDDYLTSLSAEMSYYFVLSVFPFLILLAALVGTLPFTNAWGDVLNWIILYFPRESQGMILKIVLGLTEDRRGFISIGLLGTALAASNGLMTLMQALNIVYEAKETRSYLKRLGISFAMVVLLAVLLLMMFGVLTAGNSIDRWLVANTLGLISAQLLSRISRWVSAVVLLTLGVAILDRTLPNLQRPWRKSLPGVAFMVAGWLAASAVFNLYARYFTSFDQTYGILAVFTLLMVWMYFVSIVTLVGAEINSELEKMRTQLRATARIDDTSRLVRQ